MSRNTKALTRVERQARAAELAAEVADVEGQASTMDGEPPVGTGRLDRGAHRDQMTDLKELANRLARMPRGVRRALPIDDDVHEQLDMLAVAGPGAGRRRLLMRCKLLLGGGDLVALTAALAGEGAAAERDRACIHWRTRLIDGDDLVLQAFVERYPSADRQAIRTDARESRAVGPSAERARTRLLQLLRTAAADVPD